MKRIFSIACLAAAAATSCGRSVDLGGGEEGGAGGAGDRDDDDATGGSLGGAAGTGGRGGSAGTRPRGGSSGSGPRGGNAGAYPAGSSGFGGDGIFPGGQGGAGGNFAGFGGDLAGFSGTGGDFAGFGGVAGDGVFPAGFGGVAGNGSFPAGWGGAGGAIVFPPGGHGGAGGSIVGGSGGGFAALPTCVTDLYEACWPSGSCSIAAADSTTCYESGVKIVTRTSPEYCFGARQDFYKADGSLCFSFFSGALRGQACEVNWQTWYRPDNSVVAQGSSYMGRTVGVGCIGQPTIPCDVGAGGAGTRCTWPSADVCEPGQCTPPQP